VSGLREYYAACNKGIEPACAAELQALGATDIRPGRGGVGFQADRRTAYAANLWLRSAIRVQELLLETAVTGGDDLYAQTLALPWDDWITPDRTLAVFATVRDHPAFTHSNYAALRVKDAVCDAVRAARDARPSVDTKQPDLPLKLVIKGQRALLYRDLSGTSLHRRGYRPQQVKSPLNEATAAGLILLSDWDRESLVVDPMCGSGTFVIEAALIAAGRAPGLDRPFALERWPEFDADLWAELIRDAQERERAVTTFEHPFLGGDAHQGAVRIAKEAAERAGVRDLVRFSRRDAKELVPPALPGAVFTNPPYGERLGGGGDGGAGDDDAHEAVVQSWKSLGNFLHQQCGGTSAYVLCGNRDLTKFLGLRASTKHPVMNGPIECRWLKYDIRAKRDGAPAPSASS
jgi:putative N6-adenine-specific DNA methylase